MKNQKSKKKHKAKKKQSRKSKHSEKSKSFDPDAKPESASGGSTTPQEADESIPQGGIRDTVEAIAMAFVLAFIFREFETEAFVIPTGSMAPTLYGRHKEVHCEECGYFFAIGASDEVDSRSQAYYPNRRIETTFCPNCRYEVNIYDELAFMGDRILVNKFPYEFGEPKRWDVIVFRYPEEPKTNYIKRLVGLPGEQLAIKQGDVYARKGEREKWKILRKENPEKQRQLQQLVYDDRHPPKTLLEQGYPERWQPVQRTTERNALNGWITVKTWKTDREERTHRLNAKNDREFQWLRYQHLVPSREDWTAARKKLPFGQSPQPRLITDFYGYNSYTGGNPLSHYFGVPTHENYGIFWVGDLTLDCKIDIKELREMEGEDHPVSLVIELVEGLRWYRCHLDCKTGKARLTMVDWEFLSDDEKELEEKEIATARTQINRTGTYQLTFANVDNRLCLWVDNKLVKLEHGRDVSSFASAASDYLPGEYPSSISVRPTENDLIPAGIAIRGMNAELSHLKLSRDVYYRAESAPGDADDNTASESEVSSTLQRALQDNATNPKKWGKLYQGDPVVSSEPFGRQFEQLGEDEYFAMGDNSPRSKDSRLWPNTRNAERRHAVKRSSLVGKAFYIYWPHGVPFMNNGRGYALSYHRINKDTKDTTYPKFTVPFYPHISRMKRIR